MAKYDPIAERHHSCLPLFHARDLVCAFAMAKVDAIFNVPLLCRDTTRATAKREAIQGHIK